MQEISPVPRENKSDTKIADSFSWEFLEKASPSLLLGVPVAVLLIICLLHIHTAYWVDEVYSITVSRSLPYMFHMFREYENNMSLYLLILHFWMRIFGESEMATHALSLLFAVITIPVFFALERRLMNRTSSFFGALLLSMSPLFVYYAIETRSYSLLILSVTVSSLLFVRLLRKPGYGLALGYGLSVGLGIYIHYFAILILLVHAFALTRQTLTKKYLQLWFIAGAVAVLLVSPLMLFPPRSKATGDWIFAPDLQMLWYAFSALFGRGYVILILAACLFFAFRSVYWKKEMRSDFLPEKLSTAWAFVPVLLVFLFSVLVKPVFITRYFAEIVPGAVLFVAVVVGYAGRNRAAKTAIWFLLMGIFITKSFSYFRTKGSGLKESVGFVNQQVKQGETVIIYPYFLELDMNYYLDKMGSSLPNARPVNITRSPYLLTGGGRDPDPALDIVESLAHKKGKIYFLYTDNEQMSRSDSLQNRMYKLQIRQMLANQHPVHRTVVFGPETQSPMNVVVFE
jgi:mannosyltransferase